MLFIYGFVTFIPLYRHPATDSASRRRGRIPERLLLITTVTSSRQPLPTSYFSLPACHVTGITLWIEFARRRQTCGWYGVMRALLQWSQRNRCMLVIEVVLQSWKWVTTH